MTDTVNVPREPTLGMIHAAERVGSALAGSDASSGEITAAVWAAVLAAAPKAEPVSDPDDIETLISDAIGDSMDMDWTSRDGAKAVMRTLEEEGLLVVAQTEAPKVEQEPVAWRYRVKERDGRMGGWRLAFNPKPVGANLEAQPLYTHPAPASEELELRGYEYRCGGAEEHWKFSHDKPTDHVGVMEVVPIYRLAKHKGPQS